MLLTSVGVGRHLLSGLLIICGWSGVRRIWWTAEEIYTSWLAAAQSGLHVDHEHISFAPAAVCFLAFDKGSAETTMWTLLSCPSG